MTYKKYLNHLKKRHYRIVNARLAVLDTEYGRWFEEVVEEPDGEKFHLNCLLSPYPVVGAKPRLTTIGTGKVNRFLRQFEATDKAPSVNEILTDIENERVNYNGDYVGGWTAVDDPLVLTIGTDFRFVK